jgi:hypothetical protein
MVSFSRDTYEDDDRNPLKNFDSKADVGPTLRERDFIV